MRRTGTICFTDSLDNLYTKLCAQFPFPEVNFTSGVFCRTRSINIRLRTYTHRRQCVCVRACMCVCVCHHHVNVALIVEAAKVLPKRRDVLIARADEEIMAKLKNIESGHLVFRSWQ